MKKLQSLQTLGTAANCGSASPLKGGIPTLPPNADGTVSGVSTRRNTYAGVPSSPSASSGSWPPSPPETKNQDTAAVSFFHQFTPPTATAQTRRHTRAGATYLPAATARAAALLLAVMERYRPAAPMTGPLRLSLLWTFPGSVVAVVPKVTRPDLDNLAKLALDAMTRAGYWRDDAQVVEFTTAKFAGPIPGLAVTVTRWLPAMAEEARP